MLVQSPIWCTLKDKMENEMTLVKDDLVTATKLVQDFLKPVAGEVPPTYIERMYTIVEVARLVGEERRSNRLVALDDAHSVRKSPLTPTRDARRFDPVEEARRNPVTPFVPVRTTAVKQPVPTPEVIVAQKPRKPAAPKPAKP